MSNAPTHSAVNAPGRNWWRGRGGWRGGLMALLWAGLRLWLGQWLWGTAIRLAHFPTPTKTVGAIVALVAFVLVASFIWGVLRSLWLLGVGRFSVFFLTLFLLVTAFNVLTVPDEQPWPARAWTQFGLVAENAGVSLSSAVQQAVTAPGEFIFAYNGRRNSPRIPSGFPTPDPQSTPIHAVGQPVGRGEIPTPIFTAVPENAP